MDNEKEKTYISSNLKFLRNKNGKSLNDVANICDKTDVAVHYWENGTREPNAVDIAKLSNFFNITVDDLLLKDLRFENNLSINTTENEIENNNDNDSNLLQQIQLLFDKNTDLSEESKKKILEVTKSVMNEIDKQLDGKDS